MRLTVEHAARRKIDSSIRTAVGYLSRHISSSGRFDYIYDLRTHRVSSTYNLLRHAGTTMVLYQLVGSPFDDGDVVDVASRAWSYIRNFVVPTHWAGRSCFCVTDRRVAKLGGTALALLALTERMKRSYRGASRAMEDVLLLQRLSWYLVSQQKDDGRFVSEVDLLNRNEIRFRSAYYPGQAVLALCAAHRQSGEPVFFECANSGIRYLAKRHLADPPTPTGFADHWAMIALSALHEIRPHPWYVEHLRYLVQPLLFAAEDRRPSWLTLDCTTQVSTRLEGLLASLIVELRLKEKRRARSLLQTILAGLMHCYRRQVGNLEMSDSPEDPLALGGFMRSTLDQSIRIDYVQHAVAASFGVSEILS